jgi:hypothetical protein
MFHPGGAKSSTMRSSGEARNKDSGVQADVQMLAVQQSPSTFAQNPAPFAHDAAVGRNDGETKTTSNDCVRL